MNLDTERLCNLPRNIQLGGDMGVHIYITAWTHILIFLLLMFFFSPGCLPSLISPYPLIL